MKLPIHTTALPTDLSGIKVTLVHVPVREQAVPNNAPLGVGLLAARLEQHGAEVHILDLNVRRPVWTISEARGLVEQHVRQHGAQDLWGLSGLITTLAWQQYIARCIYAVDPGAVITSGGGLATQFRSRLFSWIPELDAVAHSEGDDVILQMAWDAKHRRADVLGSKRVYDGGRPADLDALPFPAWHLHPKIEDYIRAPIWGASAGNSSATPFTMTRSMNTVSSRGCPFACVAGDTLVALPDRVFRPGDEELGERVSCPEEGHVHHLGRYETRLVSQGPKPCIRLTLSTGPQVTLTPDHRVLAVIGESAEYTQAGDLSEGDWVVIEGGQNRVTDYVPLDPHPSYPVNPIYVEKSVRIPVVLDEDMAWILGVLVADGCLPRDGRPAVHFAVKGATDALHEKVRAVFGVDLAVYDMQHTDKCQHGWLFSGELRSLIEHGVGVTPDNKLSVPEKLFRSPPSVCRAFLDGLYAADGDVRCAHRGRLTTFSRRLANECAALISWIGDMATVREYDSTVAGKPRFYVDWYDDGDRVRSGGRPSVATQVPVPFRIYRSSNSGKLYRRTAESRRHGVSRAMLSEMEPGHELLTDGWSYAQIKRVDDAGVVPVFDVEAPEPHRFSANTLAVHNCKFCFRGAQGERNYGVRSAASLAAEMRWLVERYACDFVGITDDNFMVQPKRLAELPRMLPAVAWGTHGRLDEAADKQRVMHMADAGCVYIGFGAESASPKTLKSMGKGGHMLTRGTTEVNGYEVPVTMVDGIRNTRDACIHGNCTWIRGWPGETLEDLKATVAFILWQEQLLGHACNRNLFVATAYPGTELWKDPHVQRVLRERFEVYTDEGLMSYVLELNDATKVLVDESGQPLNFSAMDDATFAQVTECVEAGELERIMDL